MPISPASVICLQPYTLAVLWLSKLAWSVVPLAGKSFQPGWTDKMNTQIVPTSVILPCLSGWAVSQAIITVVHTQMTCPLTKAESDDDKLNKTGEPLLTELGDLANVSGKSRNAFLEGAEAAFIKRV